MSIDKYNSERYHEPTAYKALSAIEEKERKLHAFRPLVYVCSPYAGDIQKNVKKGYIPIAPHLLFTQFLDDSNPDERVLGLHFGNALMSKCREVWVFGNKVTNGMSIEIAKAKRNGQTIRYFTESCEEVSGNE